MTSSNTDGHWEIGNLAPSFLGWGNNAAYFALVPRVPWSMTTQRNGYRESRKRRMHQASLGSPDEAAGFTAGAGTTTSHRFLKWRFHRASWSEGSKVYKEFSPAIITSHLHSSSIGKWESHCNPSCCVSRNRTGAQRGPYVCHQRRTSS